MNDTWAKINGKYYYFHADGYMASDEWIKGYKLDETGAWKKTSKAKWTKTAGKWSYGDSDGNRITSALATIEQVEESSSCSNLLYLRVL